MERKTNPLAFNLKRFLNFLKLFLRNKRAIFGLGIIIAFAFIAVFSSLFTPLTPVGDDPNRTGALAAKRAAPAWLRILPTWLGGVPTFSENYEPLSDPGFPMLTSEGGQLNYSVVQTSQGQSVTVGTDMSVGYSQVVNGFEFPNKNGSMAITFQRSQGTTTGETKVYLYTDFDYPYTGPPARYVGNYELLVNGSYYEQDYLAEQWYVVKLASPKLAEITGGNISILATTPQGMNIAVTTDITDYFLNNATTWALQGYQSWMEWLNGTDTLSGHWDEMKWTISGGSLTNKTYEQLTNSSYSAMYVDTGNASYVGFMNDLEICDPDLSTLDDGPDITRIAKWTSSQTYLTNESLAGSTTLYTSSVAGWPVNTFGVLPYFTVGSNETQEIVQLQMYGPNTIKLQNPLKYDHAANETVELRAKEMRILENLDMARNEKIYVLVRLSITDPYEVYRLQASQVWDPPVYPETTNWAANIHVWNEALVAQSFWRVVVRDIMLNVPVKVRVFIEPAANDFELSTTVFPLVAGTVPIGFYLDALTGDVSIRRSFSGLAENGNWIISRTSAATAISIIDKEQPDAIAKLFTTFPSQYRYGIELTFVDTGYADQNVSTTVYVDDLALKLYGTSYGLLGADQYGRDLWAQLIYGSRVSLYIGLIVSIISIAIGLTVGLVAGYLGGAADQFLMRFNDLLLVLPGLPLMIVLVAVLGARIENLILLLGFLGWNGFARLVRSQVLSLKERPFIEAAKAAGAGTGHIIIRHIVPHVMALVYVSLATAVPGAITAEAALSWLGFYDPTRMSWGRMLHEVFAAGATRNWWWVIPPGLCISLIAVAFILLGFALDDILNPKLRMRK
ncbi:ABC transporter permease [Candidatus Bathyarchaeota archaeon]|nr:ABC transporter permease [Candidatus Bathyarchaeota archaeon]